MPNYCQNYLRIKGNKDKIMQFLTNVCYDDKIGTIDANKIVPYPEKYSKLDKLAKQLYEETGKSIKNGYNSGGYEWCIDNWGTKWNLMDFGQLHIGKTYVDIGFSTAWSPPIPLIKVAATLYPDLIFTLKYYECGCAFKGTYKIKNNEIIKDETSNYNGNLGG